MGQPETPTVQARIETRVLGFNIADIGEGTVAELQSNDTAIKMLLHRMGEIQTENTLVKEQNDLLRNEINSLQTYQNYYVASRGRRKYMAAFVIGGSILTAFGVNFLSQENAQDSVQNVGGVLLFLGIIFTVISLVLDEGVPSP